jgi:arginine decarboxylase
VFFNQHKFNRFGISISINVNQQGNVYVVPKSDHLKQSIVISDIAEKNREKGLSLPALIRFPQIIHQRVNDLCEVFNNAIEQYQYDQKYLLVYPIKVNQQCEVVNEILASQYNKEVKKLGLEAGSKAELLAALALAQKPPW